MKKDKIYIFSSINCFVAGVIHKMVQLKKSSNKIFINPLLFINLLKGITVIYNSTTE